MLYSTIRLAIFILCVSTIRLPVYGRQLHIYEACYCFNDRQLNVTHYALVLCITTGVTLAHKYWLNITLYFKVATISKLNYGSTLDISG